MAISRTRLSAGAIAAVGLGTVGLGLAAPAQADTTLVYTCTSPIGDQDLTVKLDTDAPEAAATGDTVKVATVTGTVQLTPELANAMAGFLGWDYVSGITPDVTAVVSNGTDTLEFTSDLTTEKTQIFSASGWTQPTKDRPILPIAGSGGSGVVPSAGTYTIAAPDSFTSTFTGYGRDGAKKASQDSTCTYKSGSKVIDSVEVTDAGPTPTSTSTTSSPTSTSTTPTTTSTTSTPTSTSTTPTTSTPTTSTPTVAVNDWFTEPSSMQIEDGTLMATGTADKDGVVMVEMRDKDGKVLETYTWSVSEGANAKSFPFVDGTRAVRLISEDCVDSAGLTGEDGPDGSGEGNGCNVEYTFPEDQGQTTTSSTASPTGGPQTPGVVQTDSLQRVEHKQAGSPAGLVLGGLLLAGAGAGAVTVTRRRQASQH